MAITARARLVHYALFRYGNVWNLYHFMTGDVACGSWLATEWFKSENITIVKCLILFV